MMGLEEMRSRWPEKFASERSIFRNIHPGDRIFIGTGCAEPQHLVRSLIDYVSRYPTAFFDAEVIHVSTLGVAPYTDEKFRLNFRLDSFFIGESTRDPINRADADYTPIFLSALPELFRNGTINVDMALIQATPPDENGDMSLGISVDIMKAVIENASRVAVQVNPQMPYVHGDTLINIKDVDYVVYHEEPLLEYVESAPTELAQQIGKYVARIVEDGSTIQVGYGSIPNAVLSNLRDKKHLGVHTELLTDGIVELMKNGAVDNSMKTLDRGKTVATFCMARRETYRYLDRNPDVEFRQIDYTNNPLVIAKQRNMVAINSALEIDLTGQATAESLGGTLYSGIGGQADFMRGAAMAPGGKTILALPSTAKDGSVSRIVPCLRSCAGVTLTRGDIRYVVTEHGIAYLHGRNLRERAMALIAVAHPKFRAWLIEEAKRMNILYRDQIVLPGWQGIYPEHLEVHRVTKTGLEILMRPVRISDEPLLKDFFYSLSEESRYQRFISMRKEVPRDLLQKLTMIDYTNRMVILATLPGRERDVVIGMGQYEINKDKYTADIALAVRDDYQNQGVGSELLSYLTQLARKSGLLGFTAEVLAENNRVFRLFEKMGFEVEKINDAGIYYMKLRFRT
ncbi:GNAT family N-acetyltransferase [Methanothrix sp.]|uniref:GNAT family N-acetyltransferase n=1 Tax=Methanothrix sp. TaxID=90426 RepID=UPI0034E1B6FB